MLRYRHKIATLVAAALIAASASGGVNAADSASVAASNCGIAAGHDASNNTLTCNFGLTAEQMRQLTRAAVTGATAPLLEQIVTISKQLGVTEDAAKTLLRIVGKQPDVPDEGLAQALIKVAYHYVVLQAQVAALDPDNPQARGLVAQAKSEIAAGRLDAAHRLLRQARQIQLGAAEEAEKVIERAKAARDAQLLGAAGSAAAEGEVAMTELNYREAAGLFRQAADYAPPGHSDVRAKYQDREADALYREGDERGDNDALAQAIGIWHTVLQYRTRERAPLDWAMTQTYLGNALERLGEREQGTARLEEAVVAYHAALEVRTRDQALLSWAVTRADLGVALEKIGEQEAGTVRLEEAADAFRAVLGPIAAYYAALEADTRSRASWVIWAATQMNLGAALQTLGARRGSAALLEGAVTAYRAALGEYSRDQAPLQWAMTQVNLGNLLLTLGEREDATAKILEAVAAYRAALEISTRDRLPLQWALLQNNLGNALLAIGTRTQETGHLEQAVAAFNAALEVRTRQNMPRDWAMTENNLGVALKALGDRETGTGRLKDAIAAYRKALEIYSIDRAPTQWAQTEMNLGNALAALGERENDPAPLAEAVTTFRVALAHDPLPVDQASIQFGMGRSLFALSKLVHSTDRLTEASSNFQQAEAVFRAVGMARWAEASRGWIARLRDEIAAASAGPDKAATNDPNLPVGALTGAKRQK